MFVELLPLLQKRSLVITADWLAENAVRLTINQKQKDKDEKSLRPYVLEGPADEVDAVLVEQLKNHTDTVLGFHSAMDELKASTEATLKEAKAEADKKVADAKKKTGSSTSKPTPAVKPEPPKPPAPPSLFDEVPTPAEAAPPLAAATPVEKMEAAAESSDDDGDDTDPEDDPNGSDDETDEPVDDSGDVSATTQTRAEAAAVTEPAQPSMFKPSSQWEEEELLLQEVYSGRKDQLIAA